jgi:hypothetical protein
MVQRRPVELIGTVSASRPAQQVTCLLIVYDESNEIVAEDAVSTAANDVNIVWWRRISHPALTYITFSWALDPLVDEPATQNPTSTEDEISINLLPSLRCFIVVTYLIYSS